MARHSSQPAAGRSLATDSRIICSAHACPGQSRCLCCLQVFHRCRGQQLYTSRCIFMTRVTSRENKSFVSHRFCFAPNCRAAAEHLAEIHHPIPSCLVAKVIRHLSWNVTNGHSHKLLCHWLPASAWDPAVVQVPSPGPRPVAASLVLRTGR